MVRLSTVSRSMTMKSVYKVLVTITFYCPEKSNVLQCVTGKSNLS